MKMILQHKYFYAVVLILVLGVMLAMMHPSFGTSMNTQTTLGQVQTQPVDEETRLAQILSGIEGAGQVQVMITYAAQEVFAYAYDNTNSQDFRSDVFDTDAGAVAAADDTISYRLSPQVRGVVIIAQGADDFAVKMDLLQAAVTVLQIDASQVDVFAMRKD